jgi:hypothetical protein
LQLGWQTVRRNQTSLIEFAHTLVLDIGEPLGRPQVLAAFGQWQIAKNKRWKLPKPIRKSSDSCDA